MSQEVCDSTSKTIPLKTIYVSGFIRSLLYPNGCGGEKTEPPPSMRMPEALAKGYVPEIDAQKSVGKKFPN